MRRLVLVLAFTLAALGCQGQPAVLLDDPDEILAAAAASTAAATSVHADLTAEGRLAFDAFGGGAAPIDLRDTTASADLDLTNGLGRVTFSAPGLLGVAGEAIVADAGMYLKTTLTGPKYRFTPVDAPRENQLKGLSELLARTDLDPVKGDDVPCAGGTCYTLTIQLTADDLAALGGGQLPSDLTLPIPMPDLSTATVDLTLHVEQTSTRLSDVSAKAVLGDLGDLTVTSTFTRWNEPFSVGIPPPDQVESFG